LLFQFSNSALQVNHHHLQLLDHPLLTKYDLDQLLPRELLQLLACHGCHA